MSASVEANAPRVDALPSVSGTTARFVALIVLLIVSSGSMMSATTVGQLTTPNGGRLGCLLAAGGDPDQGDAASLAMGIAQSSALHSCINAHDPGPAWWVIVVWPALLVAVCALVFWLLPRWKARGLVALSVVDRDGELRRELAGLAARAGLSALPRILVDPAKASTGAVVFGSTRRPSVCLHAGLLARRAEDPAGFEAVVLHEFAHIRGGDVTLTYVTVALWRSFLLVVLLPFVAWFAVNIPAAASSPYWRAEQPDIVRSLMLTLVITALVNLARSDVLRSREIYADLAAREYGADRQRWAVADPQVPQGRLARGWSSFADLWRTHPRWEQRRTAFDDSGMLVAEPSLPIFLAGVAALLIQWQLDSYLTQGVIGSSGAADATALPAAAMVLATAGLARWRAVLYSLRTGRRVSSGIRVGVSLGAGMAFGAVISGQTAAFQWLPPHPEFLLAPVVAGVVFVWWTTQCAHLWLTVRDGRSIRWAMLLVALSSWLVMWGWLTWWQLNGTSLVLVGLDADGWRLVMEQAFPGPSAGHQRTLLAIATVWSGLIARYDPIEIAALTALCTVPLAAWIFLPTRPRDQSDDSATPLLQRALIPAVLGAVTGWIGTAGAMAFMHTWRTPNSAQSALFILIYLAWGFVALTAGMLVAGVTAVAFGDGRFSLIAAMVAADVASLLGLAGWYVIGASDGCLGPLNTLTTHCTWKPGPMWNLTQLVGAPLELAAPGAAVAGAVVAIALSRITKRYRRPARRPVVHIGRPAIVARRIGVCTVIAAVLATGVAAGRTLAQNGASSSHVNASQISEILQPGSPSPRLRVLQVGYWYDYGGRGIVSRYTSDFDHLGLALTQAANGEIKVAVFQPLCAALARDTEAAEEYFTVPDPGIQAQWASFLTTTQQAGQECAYSLSRQNGDLFIASMHQFVQAEGSLKSTAYAVSAVTGPGGSSR